MLGRIQLIRSILFGLAATLALALPLRAQDSERGSAVAIAADLSSQGGQSKLTLTLSKAVEARAFIMERPDRVVIDLPEVNFQLDSDSGRRRDGVVQSFRYGLFAPGRSRIVIDLASPATVGRIDTVTRPRDGAVLMTIPLQRVDRDTFRKAAASSDPRPAPAQTAKTTNTDPRPLIVIDAGHGGTDPGAIASTGAFEKDIVFGFAQDLAQKLNAAGRYRVQMTRDRDVFVPLNERVRIAREAKADLFISIHADSISSAPQVRGATIYTGSGGGGDTRHRRHPSGTDVTRNARLLIELRAQPHGSARPRDGDERQAPPRGPFRGAALPRRAERAGGTRLPIEQARPREIAGPRLARRGDGFDGQGGRAILCNPHEYRQARLGDAPLGGHRPSFTIDPVWIRGVRTPRHVWLQSGSPWGS